MRRADRHETATTTLQVCDVVCVGVMLSRSCTPIGFVAVVAAANLTTDRWGPNQPYTSC